MKREQFFILSLLRRGQALALLLRVAGCAGAFATSYNVNTSDISGTALLNNLRCSNGRIRRQRRKNRQRREGLIALYRQRFVFG